MIAGDIHDKIRPVGKEYEDLVNLLAEIPAHMPVCIIAGNHDEDSPSKGSPLRALVGRHYYVATNTIVQYDHPQATFILAPWGTPLEHIREALQPVRKKLPRVVVMHCAVREADYSFAELDGEQGGIDIDELMHLPADAILLGHHHNQQIFVPHIAYAGSPEVIHDFSEAHQGKG